VSGLKRFLPNSQPRSLSLLAHETNLWFYSAFFAGLQALQVECMIMGKPLQAELIFPGDAGQFY